MIKFLFDRDTWQEVFDSFNKNRLRAILTMIGVWWGILLLIGLLGSARGLANSFNRLFGDFATNSIFIWGRNTSEPFKGFQKGRSVNLSLADVTRIKKHVEGIQFALPRSRSSNTSAVHGFLSGNFSITGDYPLLDKLQKKHLMHGRFLNQSDVQEKRKVVVISDEVYKQLFEKEDSAIGQYIQLNSINFKVIGVFKESERNLGPGSDMIVPFPTFQQIYNRGDEIDWMIITGKPEYNISEIESNTKIILKNLNDIAPKDDFALGSFNLGKEFKKLTNFLTGMQFLTWFVGIATLIAGVFAIGNILLITVKERTKEIGVRRALGATPFEIKRQIVVESVFLTLVAGIAGIITGGWILIALDAAFGQGDEAVMVNASVPITIVFIALLILVVLGTLIGLIPAFKATSIKPIEALREE